MQIKSSPIFPRRRWSPGLGVSLLALIALIALAPFWGRLLVPTAESLSNTTAVSSEFNQLPLAFIASEGQNNDGVRFETYGTGHTAVFTPEGVELNVQQQTLQLGFVGANPAPSLEAGALLPGKINDFRGQDASNWQVALPTYAGVVYQQLYPGISLQYEGGDGALKSTYAVAPGADPALIRWQYSGAQTVAVDSATGDLQIALSDQTQIVEKSPVAWQEVNGRRQTVPVAFALSESGTVGFSVGSYDANAPLIIDPTIVYETTTSLANFDSGRDIAVDASGNVYVVGRAYDANNDIFVAKLSANGTLLYTTYLRGSRLDYSRGITLDDAGGVYLAGWTDSTDFPILNAMQPTKNGNRDAFIAKLSAQSGALLFSTYFGGNRAEEIHDITLNSAGEIYLVGYTDSTTFPTVNPIQGGLTLNECFCEDTFVTKLSADASTVLYSTYLGGTFEDYGESIALDANDNIYIVGRTQSDDFPTQAAIQPNRAGQFQDEDAFVTKITADGSSLVYSTYLGGTQWDRVSRVAVDGAGNAFVTGSTRSADFPTTPGAFQDQFVGGINDCGIPGFGGPRNCDDMFVTKLVPDGSALAYSTYIGGGLDDTSSGIALDSSGQAAIVGYSQSSDFPPASGSGVTANIILAKLSTDGSELLYSVKTFSAVANDGHGIALDSEDNAYITGAQNAPADLYVAKIADDGSPPQPTPTPSPTSTAVPPTPTPTTTPPPTPTPAGGNTTHIADLDGSSAFTFRQFAWQATVEITVHNTDHFPVAGAVVSGTWSGGESGPDQCVTDSNGNCSVSTDNMRRRYDDATFTVDNIVHADYTYAAISNHDAEGDSNGTFITVSQP
ncbi:MAG: hypothetical protein CL608_11165 [Anaerolineaceae bacterium]|nr:hypothetical protein [Anaerolineaceae bacterium]